MLEKKPQDLRQILKNSPRRKFILKMNATFGTHPDHEDRYSIKSFEKRTKPGGAGGIPTPAHILTITDKKGEDFKLEYKNPKVWKTSTPL